MVVLKPDFQNLVVRYCLELPRPEAQLPEQVAARFGRRFDFEKDQDDYLGAGFVDALDLHFQRELFPADLMEGRAVQLHRNDF